ncbi:cysteine synthase [Vibrio maritimus]|uniref:cysteine synthase n=1 Tax=Vibrio maritimus TaxID=990268 RepID=A0A090RP59_9VIBR|nr:cysteine synthase [Vibrio maritimus]
MSNYRAHYLNTGPEIWQQTQGNIDALVSVVGTGGTIAGNSHYLSQQKPDLKTWLVDPDGSGIYSFLKDGQYQSKGSSFTEGIGIMRTVENFRKAKIDHAITLPDQDLVTISRLVAEHDGIVLGSSSSLNVAGAFYTAARMGKGKTIVTFSCDLADRSYSKLYNEEFLKDKEIVLNQESLEQIWARYMADGDSKVVNVA